MELSLLDVYGGRVPNITPGEGEGIESVLRRFKREVAKAGIFADMKKHRFFETPIEKRKRKEIAKHKHNRRKRSFRV